MDIRTILGIFLLLFGIIIFLSKLVLSKNTRKELEQTMKYSTPVYTPMNKILMRMIIVLVFMMIIIFIFIHRS